MPWTPSGPEVGRGFAKLTQLNRNDPAQGLQLRSGSEKFGYYLVDGVRQFPVSSKAPMSGDVSPGRLSALRRYLQLSRNEFQALCQCQITGPQYHTFILDKLGLDEPPPVSDG
jgi:hypothetical protein